jgi:hypothetical protein
VVRDCGRGAGTRLPRSGLDGPGQGAVIREKGLPFRPDWEQVLGADGNMATESINAMSQRYLGKSTYPLRDPAGGEVRSLYRVLPNRAQVFGHA